MLTRLTIAAAGLLCRLRRSKKLCFKQSFLPAPLGKVPNVVRRKGEARASQLIYRVATKNFPANRLLSYIFDAKYEEAICGR